MERKGLALVTGADGGMGRIHVRELAKAGYEVIMAVIDENAARPVMEEIQRETNGTLHLMPVNLGDLADIVRFADEVKARFPSLQVLLNNAGVLPSKPKKSVNNIELTMAVNYLGHYTLTNLLHPIMGNGTRIVSMISLSYFLGKITPELFKPKTEREYNRFNAYGSSKLALYYFMLDASEAWKKEGICFNVSDPFIVSTNIIRMDNIVVDKLCDWFFRPFINTYLNLDGSYYSETKPDGKYKTFPEEMADRDQRLGQTIRSIDYERKNDKGEIVRTTADYNHSLTGYHVIKFTVDDAAFDLYGANGNDIPLMRYAEVLLNYAEAKAELGTLTDDDWRSTIGVLRRRAGITGGALDSKPTTVDPYLKNTFYPDVTDPVILEIRRERTIELCLEGFRLKDLKRWACGNLWADLPWTGICIPAYDTPLDMNGDGVYDVYYPDPRMGTVPDPYTKIAVSVGSPLKFISVPGGLMLRDDLPGRVWYDRMYLDPISTTDIVMNGNLAQNPGY